MQKALNWKLRNQKSTPCSSESWQFPETKSDRAALFWWHSVCLWEQTKQDKKEVTCRACVTAPVTGVEPSVQHHTFIQHVILTPPNPTLISVLLPPKRRHMLYLLLLGTPSPNSENDPWCNTSSILQRRKTETHILNIFPGAKNKDLCILSINPTKNLKLNCLREITKFIQTLAQCSLSYPKVVPSQGRNSQDYDAALCQDSGSSNFRTEGRSHEWCHWQSTCKAMCCMVLSRWTPRVSKSLEDESRLMFAGN